ncbi:MAG: uroporphyrinogen-III synthase [Rhodospirillaceae bacterium]|jgi:uroporphyrinogen-III synthase|nr:uroporphyrinogen-III synthase [Rhodospirillaceae bacterium]
MRVLVTRPEPEASRLAAALAARGIESALAPLMEIRDRPQALSLDGVRAVLATSANGVRAFARAEPGRDLPLFAVGAATAEAARDAGFRHVVTAGGDVATLAERVVRDLDPAAGALLHVAGTVTAGDLAGRLGASGFEVRRAVLYEARPVARLPAAAVAALRAGEIDGVLFFSPRTARAFVSLIRTARIAPGLRNSTAYCLSRAVAAEAAALEWRAVHVAETPDQPALLSLVAAGMQEPPPQGEDSP